MRRLRIIHVIDSLGTGGAEEGIRKLLRGLDPEAFEQIICTIAPAVEVEPTSGTRVVSLSKPDRKKNKIVLPQLKRLFELEHPDVVHSRNWGAIEAVPAARLARIGCIIHSEHGLELSTYRKQPWRRNLLRRFFFYRADRVFAVSKDLRTYYTKLLRLPLGSIGVIANGVDTNKFQATPELRSSYRQQIGVSGKTVVIGTIGRLDPIKDHRTLLHAVDLLLLQGLPVQLVVVGDGEQRNFLEADVRSRRFLNGRATFTGATNDVISALSGFDIFVLPSLAEGMSNALLEAMSASLACVATSAGGNPELIEHGKSGLLFKPGRAADLAALLKTLASDALLRRTLGVNARKRIENEFSLERMLSNYTELYRNVATRRKRSSPHIESVRSENQQVAATD